MKKLKSIILVFTLMLVPLFMTSCKNKEEELKIAISLESNQIIVGAGEAVEFLANVNKDNLGLPKFEIVEGVQYATINNDGYLMVNDDAPNNAVIKIKASIGNTSSNIYELKVELINLETISLALANTNIERGEEKQFGATLSPLNATNKKVTYEIIAGADYATLTTSGLLKVNSDAPINQKIRVRASQGTLKSNTIELTIIETAESIFDVSLNGSTITLDINGTTNNNHTISAIAFDSDYKRIKDDEAQFTYTIFSGNEYVNLDAQGVVTPKGHGEAIIRVTIAGSNGFAELKVNSIVPPSSIDLPSELEGKTRYGFGLSDDFEFEIVGKGNPIITNQIISNQYTYEFLVNNVKDSNLATFNDETKEITFNQVAVNKLVEIKVTSVSGSIKEATRSFFVNVNDGLNIYSIEDIKNENDKIKTTDENGNSKLGILPYKTVNFISDAILTKDVNRTISDALMYYMNFYGDTTIYGNGHEYNIEEREWYNANPYQKLLANYYSPIMIKNYKNDVTYNSTYNTVNVFDIRVTGKVKVDTSFNDLGMDFELASKELGFKAGIYVQGVKNDHVDKYHDGTITTKPSTTVLNMDNVLSSGFVFGIYLEHIVNSTVSNSEFRDCYESGIQIYGSIATFENITFGRAGSAGIELGPENSYYAGTNFDERQTITFKGNIECNNVHGFDNAHMIDSRKTTMYSSLIAQVGGQANMFESSFINENGEDKINLAILLFNEIDNSFNVLTKNESRIFTEDLVDTALELNEQNSNTDPKEVKYVKITLIKYLGLNIGTIYIMNPLYEGE